MSAPADVDAYIAAQPEPVRFVLDQVRETIHDAVPGLEETIKYSMPTMTLDGKVTGALRRVEAPPERLPLARG